MHATLPAIRESGLDAIRAFAALIVLAAHASLAANPAHPPLDPRLAHLGVALFFVLSGYLIAKMVRRVIGWRSYAIRRLLRIYPAYLAALVGLALITGNDSLWHNPLGYLTFTQPILQTDFHAFVGVAWTLKIEMLFYLVAPLLFLLPLSGVMALCGLSLAVTYIASLTSPNIATFAQTIDSLPFRLWEFAPGIWFAYRGAPKLMRSPAVLVVGIVVMVMAASQNPHLNPHATIAATLLVGWALARRPQFGWWASAGAALSYSVYLWHGDLLRWSVANHREPQSLLLAFGLTFAISALVYLIIEKPAIGLGRTLTLALRQDQTVAQRAADEAPVARSAGLHSSHVEADV